VLAGPQCGERHRVMARRRRRDEDRVQVRSRQHRRQVAAGPRVGMLLLGGVEQLRVEVADLGDAGGGELTERSEQVLAPVPRPTIPT
jgi:hypothetical protein